MSGPSWQESFLAMSAVLSEPLDASLAALGSASVRVSPRALELLRELRASSREVRARAIARVLSAVVVDLERMQFA
jgi:hypothetical protein